MTSCVLDSDVVIAALDDHDAHHPAALDELTALRAANVQLLLSLVNYAEVLVRPAAEERTMQMAVRALEQLGVELVAPTPSIARDAARLRALSISLGDGFALATARARNASVASFDRRVRRALLRAGLELAAVSPPD